MAHVWQQTMGQVLCRGIDVCGKKTASIKQSAYYLDPKYGMSADGPKAHANTYKPFSHHVSASFGSTTNHQS